MGRSKAGNRREVAMVTGAGGFVGRRMVEMLVERDYHVKCLDVVKSWDDESLGCEWVVGDLRKKSDCQAACEGVDVIFHIASIVVAPTYELYMDINVQGTQNLIDAAVAAGVQRFVYTSSGSVVYAGSDIHNGDETYPYPTHFLDTYSESKAKAERLVLDSDGREGLRTAAIRPHSIYGPGDRHFFPRVIENARAGKLKVQLGNGENLSDFTYVDNCVEGHLLAAEHLRGVDAPAGGEAFFITDCDPRPFWAFMRQVGVAAGVDDATIGKVVLPYTAALFMAKAAEGFRSLCGCLLGNKPATFTPHTVALACTHHYYSTDKARRILGYKPLFTSEQGMRRSLDWLAETGVIAAADVDRACSSSSVASKPGTKSTSRRRSISRRAKSD